jgi:CheY-like chemotaxis protein
VVDDEPSVATVIADLLATDGHDVETLTSATAALDRLATRPYDVVFTDVRMPELDGVAFYRALEQRHPALCARLIFLTGDTLDPILGEFLRQSGHPSVAKPCALPQLRRALAQVLAPAPSAWAPRMSGGSDPVDQDA